MNYFRPVFKNILKLKEISAHNYKIFKFKKKKWQTFLTNYKWQSLNIKFLLTDQNTLLIHQRLNKRGDYKDEFRHHFFSVRNFNIFYLNSLKKNTKLLKKKDNNDKLNFFENRVDLILFRAKFALTIRFIRKLITNNSIHINNKIVVNKSYVLLNGDFINLNFYFKNYQKNLVYCSKWPLPLNNIIINYNIKKIIYLGNLNLLNSFLFFPYYLKLRFIFY